MSMSKNKKIGQRRTTQRQAILNSIIDAGQPMTVAQIHEVTEKRLGKLGIATVYRTVKLLLEKEQIQVVSLPDGESRYEAAHLGHHHHFQCKSCSEVYDIEMCPVKVTTELPDGFELTGHHLTLYGLCPKC